MKKCNLIKGIAFGMAVCICANVVSEGAVWAADIKERTVSMDGIPAPNPYEGDSSYAAEDSEGEFQELPTDEEMEEVEKYENGEEEISLTEEELEELEEEEDDLDEEDLEEYGLEDEIDLDEDDLKIEYECGFDMNDLVFHFSSELVDESGEVLATETHQTEAIVTETGGLDACIEYDGKTYMLSDYRNQEKRQSRIISITGSWKSAGRA